MKTETIKVSRAEGQEPERLAAEGFLPCGIAWTDVICPDCGGMLMRFRAGMAGGRFYDPRRQESRLCGVGDESLYWCRKCLRCYR